MIPCLAGHEKYSTPLTVPSFLPDAVSSSIPTITPLEEEHNTAHKGVSCF